MTSITVARPGRLICLKCGLDTPAQPFASEVTHNCLKTRRHEVLADETGRLVRQPAERRKPQTQGATVNEETKIRTGFETKADGTTNEQLATITDLVPPIEASATEKPKVIAELDERKAKREAKKASTAKKAPAKKAPAKKAAAAKKAPATKKAAEPKPAATPNPNEKKFPVGSKVEIVSAGWSVRGWMVGETGTVLSAGRARISVKLDAAKSREKLGSKVSDDGGYGIRPECLKKL